MFSDARGRTGTLWGTEQLATILIMAGGGAYTFIMASDTSVVEWLRHVTSDQRINECEGIAALLGLATIASTLEGVDLLYFVDASAVQGILIKGYSRSPTLSAVTSAYWTLAGQCKATMWIGRVPSKLNVADGPTRGDYTAVQAHGWAYSAPYMPPAKPWQVLFTTGIFTIYL